MKKIMEWLEATLNAFVNGAAQAGGADAKTLKLDDAMLKIPNALWDYVAIIGVGLTLMYFLFEMNQKYALEGRDMNLKTIGVPFLKCVIAFAILGNGGGIVSGMLNGYNRMIDAVSSETGKFVVESFGVGDEYTEASKALESIGTEDGAMVGLISDTVEAIMTGSNIITALLVAIVAMILTLISAVLGLVWDYKAIVFKLELLYRVGITPIAFADIYNGMSSNGIRWLKGFIGMALYGAAFILIPRIGNAMMMTTLWSNINNFVFNPDALGKLTAVWDVLGSLAGCLVVPFAELGVLSAIRQLTKEVI